MFTRLCLGVILAWLAVSPAHAENHFVRNQNEYAHALAQIEAGDVIILANGVWRDFEMVITGEGRADAPITIISEEPGKVFLTGQSSLRIGGNYIFVTGLIFRDGYSPRGEVISFRRNKQDLARNSRVTEVVIDGFSKPDRYESDYWVGLYGQSNRFDHNLLVGKTNKGVTLAVRLDSEESRENNHRIDHNYFGPRPVLGSNGGETLRVGTSRYSMFNSNTLVENNIFDRCDGEVEIISSKAGGNIYRGNVFLRSRGTLTLRHGDGNLVERNVFLGEGKDYTGGIRVINQHQTVRHNYMEGLRGTGFSSALTVMNGVPNSPVNRYVQVLNAHIANNTVIDSRRITLGAGADEERSAPPIESVFANNLLGGLESGTFIEVDADISGIAFSGNRITTGNVHSALSDMPRAPVAMERAENGLLYPADEALSALGAPRDLQPVALDQVGVNWYAKPSNDTPFATSGNVTAVAAQENALVAAIANAETGDVLELAHGEHVIDRTIQLGKAITIKGATQEDGQGAVLMFSRPSLFELREGGNLQLINLVIDGALAPDSVGNAVIRTTTYPIKSNFQIEMDSVQVRGLVVNKSFNVLTLGKSTLADRVLIRNSSFSDITGAVLSASAETEDFGQYNVEYLDIIDSAFNNVGGPVADVYRGGRDESTFGPFVTFTGNALSNVGLATTNGSGASLNLHGVQTTKVARNAFFKGAPLRIVHTVGTPVTSVEGNAFTQTAKPVLEELNYEGEPRVLMAGNVLDGEPVE